MGCSAGTLLHFGWLALAGRIPRGARMLDFGSQNLFGDFPPGILRQFVDHFTPGSDFTDADFSRLTASHGKLADLFWDGQYVAFDMYTEKAHKTRTFDLNVDSLSPDDIGAFDVVANSGTFEHIANQFNCFKVAHQAARVGGVMYHHAPMFGQVDHGLVKYEPKCFTTLIANNGYRVLYWGFTPVYNSIQDLDFYRGIGNADGSAFWEGKFLGCADMVVILQKTKDSEFVPPADFVLAGDVNVSFPFINDVLPNLDEYRRYAGLLNRQFAAYAVGGEAAAREVVDDTPDQPEEASAEEQIEDLPVACFAYPRYQANYLVPRVQALVDEWVREKRRVLIYAAGEHTARLARWTCLGRADIVGVADSNEELQATFALGHKVVSPGAIDALEPDVILISSAAFQEEIYEQLGRFREMGIAVVRIYSQEPEDDPTEGA